MFYKIIQIINTNYKHKKKFLKLTPSKNDMHILMWLTKYNIIKYFKKINKTNYLIFLKYFNNKNLFSIKNLYRPSNVKYIDLKNLKKICEKQNNVYLMSTNQGILSSNQALNKKVGGIMLTKISL